MNEKSERCRALVKPNYRLRPSVARGCGALRWVSARSASRDFCEIRPLYNEVRSLRFAWEGTRLHHRALKVGLRVPDLERATHFQRHKKLLSKSRACGRSLERPVGQANI